MRFRPKALVAVAATAALAFGAAACSSDDAAQSAAQTTAATQQSAQATATPASAPTGGPGGAVSVDGVDTVDELVALIQEAYGDAGLGLQRGHQPVEGTLIDVLGITHEEMHVRMESQGQNLAAVATDLGIDPQTLIDALVDAWAPAIDTLEQAGTITADQADAYRQALEDAFTFRVTWNGQDATPTATAVA